MQRKKCKTINDQALGADLSSSDDVVRLRFILSLRPLTDNGIVPKDHAFSCTSITGYSGGGKRLIKKYHEGNFTAPQQYAQGQMHKHLPEMKKMAKIDRYPIFTPVVANYYSGMQVIVPLEKTIMKEAIGIKGLTEIYKDRYSDSKMIEVLCTVYKNSCSSVRVGIWERA